jgi:hypothetical protein
MPLITPSERSIASSWTTASACNSIGCSGRCIDIIIRPIRQLRWGHAMAHAKSPDDVQNDAQWLCFPLPAPAAALPAHHCSLIRVNADECGCFSTIRPW